MDWASAIGGFITGLVSGYTIKLAIDIRRSSRRSTGSIENSPGSVVQSGNVAGGHIAGGSIRSDSK